MIVVGWCRVFEAHRPRFTRTVGLEDSAPPDNEPMPKPLRLPDDDRPRKKKKPADGPPVGPIIGAVVGGLLLVGGLVVGVWALTREGPPPPRPAVVPTAPSSAAKTPPTQPKPPTADEYYQWLCGGVWTRTADDKRFGGKGTVSLTFLPDKALVIKQSVPNPLAGLGGEGAAATVDTAATVGVTAVEILADGKELRIRTDEKGLLGVAPYARFKLRFEPDGKTIRLTEPGDESRWQDTPFRRG